MKAAIHRSCVLHAVWCLGAASHTALASEKDTSTFEGPGLVYAYGERIDSPFEFTGAAGDTLYLNGIPVLPTRKAHPDADDEGTQNDREATQDPIFAEIDELVERIRAELREAAVGSATADELVHLQAQLFRDSPLVEKVLEQPGGCYVTFKDLPEIRFGLPRLTDSTPHPLHSPENVHNAKKDLIRRVIESGGLYAYGKGYEEIVPRRMAHEVRDLIAASSAGLRISHERENPPPFDNRAFLRDLNQVNGHAD